MSPRSLYAVDLAFCCVFARLHSGKDQRPEGRWIGEQRYRAHPPYGECSLVRVRTPPLEIEPGAVGAASVSDMNTISGVLEYAREFEQSGIPAC